MRAAVACYMAWVWNAANPAVTARARAMTQRFIACSPGWRLELEANGLIVSRLLEADSGYMQLYPLANDAGLILGKLFERRDAEGAAVTRTPPAIVFDARRTERLLQSAGRTLLTDYWGQYVAFLQASDSHRAWIIRDPSGGVPCQHVVIQGVDVYFVRLEDVERLEPLRGSINTHYLLGRLAYNSICVRETGLTDVQTVLPGECIEHVENRRSSQFYWNPLEIARSNVIDDPIEAARELRHTVRACVQSWASCFDGILHLLSGGLDSSIVLSCLADVPGQPRVLCLNEYSEGRDADERSFARRAAAQGGFELVEKARNGAVSLEPLRAFPRSPYPFPLPNADAAREQADLAQLRELQAAFAGLGGDELFLRFNPMPRAVDLAFGRRWSSDFFPLTLTDAAERGISVWRVLRAAVRYGVRRKPVHISDFGQLQARTLLAPQVVDNARHDRTLWHPLYRERADLAPGKTIHAYSLTACTARGHTPGHPEHAPVTVLPLISQPLMELSLRIPTYVLNAGGADRSLARAAFADDLPQEIRGRTRKGHIQQFVQDMVTRNMPLIREVLIDGFLVREGFVNETALRRTLANKALLEHSLIEVFELLNVEAWARSWLPERKAVPLLDGVTVQRDA